MLALIDALYWQIVMWMILTIAIVNVFIRIQVYLLDPGHDEFAAGWFEAFEANQMNRYKDGGMNWRVRDLGEHWASLSRYRDQHE